MSTLSKAALLEKALSKPVARAIKALGGGSVLIKKLSAGQAEDYFFSVQAKPEAKAEGEAVTESAPVRKSMRGKLLQLCLVTEDGAPMFPTVDEVDAMDNDVIAELFEVCQAVNGFTKEAADEAKKD